MLRLTIFNNMYSRRDKRRKKIKRDLAKKGITPAEVARQLGVTPQMVSMVIAGNAISERIQVFIENTTGKKYFNGKK